MSEIYGLTAFSPGEIAAQVKSTGVTKARLPALSLLLLGILAGGFIGFGALFFTLITGDPTLTFGVGRLLGSFAFCLGLILVVIAGAELFTGNNLLVMAWVSGQITLREVLRNWGLVLLGNAIGGIGLAVLVTLAETHLLNDGQVGEQALRIAAGKIALPAHVLFFRGVACNILVCLAVWMAMAGRTVSDKVLAVLFPITGFVMAGFEHSIANLFFIPWAIFLQAVGPSLASAAPGPTWLDLLSNLIPVLAGNIVGGSGLVGLVYWMIYREVRNAQPTPPSS